MLFTCSLVDRSWSASTSAGFRFTQTMLVSPAAAARQWYGAEEHFQTAMQQAESLPDRLAQAEIRRFHAMMLIDRATWGLRKSADAASRSARDPHWDWHASPHGDDPNAPRSECCG
jgi:hypothetical protein